MERFAVDRVEVCPVQLVEPTERVTQLGSLDRIFVKAQMLPNAIGGIDRLGKFVDLRRGRANTDGLRQLTVITMGSWGRDGDLMVIDIDEDRPPAFIDVPQPVLATTMAHHALILESFQNDGNTQGKAYYGENHSAGTLEGSGLQSVLAPHSHVFKFSEAQDDLTPKEIIATRDAQVWDQGVSRVLGEQVGGRIQREVLPLYRNGEVRADAMGFTINMPEFSAADIGDPDFVGKFLRPLSLITHDVLRRLHSQVFRSDLNQVIGYVQSRRNSSEVDKAYYESFFARADIPSDAPAHIKRLHEFYESGELRKPAGWALGIQISSEGGLAAVSFSTRKESLGPVEGFGVRLVRPSDPLPESVMEKRRELYHAIIDKQVGIAA